MSTVRRNKKQKSLRQKVAAYANQRIPTTEYKEITAQIEQAQEKLNRLNDAKERFGATGGKVNSTSYKKMQYDIEDLANVIKYAKSELDDLEASGKLFISGVNTKRSASGYGKANCCREKNFPICRKQFAYIVPINSRYIQTLI